MSGDSETAAQFARNTLCRDDGTGIGDGCVLAARWSEVSSNVSEKKNNTPPSIGTDCPPSWPSTRYSRVRSWDNQPAPMNEVSFDISQRMTAIDEYHADLQTGEVLGDAHRIAQHRHDTSQKPGALHILQIFRQRIVALCLLVKEFGIVVSLT